MSLLFTTLLEILFPPRDTELLVRNTTQEELEGHMVVSGFRKARTLFPYHDPLVRAFLWELKYHNNKNAAIFLGNILKRHILVHVTRPHLIIPIPLSPKRFRERGYNQVEELLKLIVIDLPLLTYAPHILKRRNSKERQTMLKKEERKENVRGVFYVPPDIHIQGKEIILIDDVITTGATLEEAAGTLKRAGARSIHSVALAH